jgi:prevent-host-death family protein
MNIVNIQAAKTHLSKLVEDVVAGEEVILAKAGKPLVRLLPFKPHQAPRTGGQWAGQVWECSDCWKPEEEDLLNTGANLMPDDLSFAVHRGGALLVAEETKKTGIRK